MISKKPNIGILTFPISDAGNIPLLNLINILDPISNRLCLITGNAGYRYFKDSTRIDAYCVEHVSDQNSIGRISRYVSTQIKLAYKLGKMRSSVDLWIFFIGGQELVIPMLVAKLFRKKVILYVVEYSFKSGKSMDDSFYKQMKILSNINRSLCDRIGIALESESIISFFELTKYKNKILTLGYYIDSNEKPIRNIHDRKNIVGYVGRLSAEKGVLELMRAIPLIISKRNDVEFLIVGDGILMDSLKEIAKENGCSDKVKFTGWINHDNIPYYLGEMKIHLLPSFTEAFGGAAIEAMSCGAISIANSVGGLPDIIKDGKTGFLLKDNQPKTIADKITEVLDNPELESIQKCAIEYVARNLSYESSVELCKRALCNALEHEIE